MVLSRGYDFIIQWHLTEKCNLKCRHCYQEGKHVEEMTLPEIKRVVRDLTETIRAWQDRYQLEFSPSFNITGGEPFLREDFFEILETLAETGFDLYVLSNGAVVTAKRARRLVEMGVKEVQVSLEGPEPVHELIRGRGSFAAALTGVRRLLEAGMKVSLNATLSRVNAPYLPALIELAQTLRVQSFGFSRLVPSGRGLALLDSLLAPQEVKDLYETAFSLKVAGLEISSGDPVASQMAEAAEGDAGDIASGGCAAGVAGITILPDGTVLPCRRLPIPLGNLREDSFREIWATSPVLEALRDRSRYHGKCRACPRWAVCRGCRAMAYAFSQSQGTPDYLGEDPQCFIPGSS